MAHARHAVQPQELEPLGELGVVDGDGAALAAGQILGGVEAEAGRIGQVAGPYAVAHALDAVRRILDQAQAMLVGDGLQRAHVAHQAVEMHRHDGPGVGGDGGFHPRRIEVAGVGLDIDEHRCGAGLEDGCGGGDKAHRRGDDLIARADIQSQQRQVQRARAARHAEGVALAQIGRKPLLERRHLRAGREDVAFQHLGEAVELGLAEVVAEVGDLPGHHWRCSPSATLLATGGRRVV